MSDDNTRAELAALRATVAELRREIAELRQPQRGSMRQSGRCPSCGGGALIKFRRVEAPGSGGELSLQKVRGSWGTLKPAGLLEAYACRACKLVEWNAESLDDIAVGGDDVTDVVTDATPHR